MTLISRSLIRKLVLLLAPLAAVFIASPAGIAQKKQDESRTMMTWEHSDDGLKRRCHQTRAPITAARTRRQVKSHCRIAGAKLSISR